MKFRLKPEQQFLILIFIIFIVIGVIINLSLTKHIKESFVNERKNILVEFANNQANLHLTRDVFLPSNTGSDKNNLEIFKKYFEQLSIHDITVIKIYNLRNQIIYSNENNLIGKKFLENNLLNDALLGNSGAKIINQSGSESLVDGKNNQLLAIYAPIIFTGDIKPFGAVEIDSRLNELNAQILNNQIFIISIIILSLLILFLSLYWIFKRSSEKIQELHEEETKNLKKISDLKNEFVFIATHELRTPVTAISWSLETIIDEFNNYACNKENIDRINVDLFNIQLANQRLLALVNDLLEVARAESNKLKITSAPINIVGATKKVISELKIIAEKKNIIIDYQSPEKQLIVFADSNKLKEVLSNLITNAIKYNRYNQKVIVRHKLHKDYVITEVADNGIGLTAEDKENIFTKFWRSEKVKEIKGTGLGLFITKQLVERMGGKLWFNSKENEGTTFSFKLPTLPKN